MQLPKSVCVCVVCVCVRANSHRIEPSAAAPSQHRRVYLQLEAAYTSCSQAAAPVPGLADVQ